MDLSEWTKGLGETLASVVSESNGILIGEPSFGKATMESTYELNNGYASKFSVAKLFDAKGRSWEQSGLEPNIMIKDEQDSFYSESPALKAGLAFLKRG